MDNLFAGRLRTARMSAKIKAKDLAGFAGISAGYLSQLEGGSRVMPAAEVVGKIAQFLGVSVEWLLSGDGAAPPQARVIEPPREGYSPPQPDHAKIAALEKQLAEVKAAHAVTLAERDRLLKVVEDLATSIAGPRPAGQGRADAAAPAGVPAVPASGVLYKTRRSKSA